MNHENQKTVLEKMLETVESAVNAIKKKKHQHAAKKLQIKKK